MDKGTRFVGLDVHKASIAVAAAGAFGDPEDHGQIPNEPAAIRRLFDRLGRPVPLTTDVSPGARRRPRSQACR